MTGPAKKSFPAWAGTAWMVALVGVSLFFWGRALLPGAWLGVWTQVFGEALAGFFLMTGKDPGILWGVLVCAGAALFGRAILCRLVPEPPAWGPCFGAGVVALSLGGLCLGGLGLFRPLPLTVFSMVIFGAGVIDFGSRFFPGRKSPLNPRRLRMVEALPLIVVGLLLFIANANPTLFYDALSYHLSLPRQYLLSGSTAPLFWHPYSYFPQTGELLLGIGLTRGVVSAQLMMVMVWLFSVLAIRDLAERFLAPGSGPAAVLVSIGSLTFAFSAMLITIDPLVLLFAVTGLHCLCGAGEAWRESDDRKARRWLLAWAMMAAGAAGAKYTAGLLVLGLQGIFIAFIFFRAGEKGLRAAAPGLLLALLLCLPWPIRNYLESGNPLMPMPVMGFSGLPEPAWKALRLDAHAMELSFSALPGILASPWTMVFAEPGELAASWGAAEFVGPMIFLGAALFLFFRKRARAPSLVLVYGLAAFFLSVSMFRMTRFAYPGLGALAAVSGAGIHLFFRETRDRIGPRILSAIGLGLIALLCASILIRSSADLTAGYRYLRVGADLETYINERARINRFQVSTILLQLSANRELPENAVVLMVGETRFFYLDRKCIAPSYLTPNPALVVLASNGPASAAAALYEAGVTHVLVSFPELKRLQAEYKLLGLDPALGERLARFVSGPYCRPLLDDRKIRAVLCELTPPVPQEEATASGPR